MLKEVKSPCQGFFLVEKGVPFASWADELCILSSWSSVSLLERGEKEFSVIRKKNAERVGIPETRWAIPFQEDQNISMSWSVRTGVCGNRLGGGRDRGEMPIELGDSWSSKKPVLAGGSSSDWIQNVTKWVS